ncbi:MAG: DUF502 domain-containing protein [Desulfobacterales bacterium]|nr:MAG: DUF502 domain-containing protein [Desulfobacterales bacterium]
MNRIKAFIKTSILGGLAVILPAIFLILIFRWLFNWITDIIQPFTNLMIAKGQFQEIVADVLVITIILAVCFLVGVVIKTKVGQFIQDNLENRILQLAPGYPTIKSVVMQFIGKKKSPFSSVALVQVFGNETLMTAFITDTHENGRYTVFVPTGPNPTSGLIFHLQKKYVHPVNVSVEETMRSVIGCGAGSTNLLDAFEGRTTRS